MISQKITVINKTGLHARPASNLVKAAMKFKSKISITKAEKQYDVKSILSILTAGVVCGTEIILSCEGEDEDLALKTIADYIEAGLDE